MVENSSLTENNEEKCATNEAVSTMSASELTTEEIPEVNDKPLPFSAVSTMPAAELITEEIPEVNDEPLPFSELQTEDKIVIVCASIFRLLFLIAILYVFICALELMTTGFRLLSGKSVGKVLNSKLLENPLAQVMIGTLLTALLQASSTVTSIIVTMVASESIDVIKAIPIVMGANIGTTITSIIVSLAHSGDRNKFGKTFTVAAIHVTFNIFTTLVLLPIEVASGYLYHASGAITEVFRWQSHFGNEQGLMHYLTKPVITIIIELDDEVIDGIAMGDNNYLNRSLVKVWCSKNITTDSSATDEPNMPTRCDALFNLLGMSDIVSGIVVLGLSGALLVISLVIILKTLTILLTGQTAKVVTKMFNIRLPGRLAYFTGYIAILVGCGFTFLIQSSSVFISTLVPLVGIGILSFERAYPLIVGSNIGTTGNGIFIAMSASGHQQHSSIQIAVCHFLFNVTGMMLFYAIPQSRMPLILSQKLGSIVIRYRWSAFMLVIMTFLLVPTFILLLASAGEIVFISVGVPVLAIIISICVLNICMSKCPRFLPRWLQTWEWLPLWMHSIQPYDVAVTRLRLTCGICCDRCLPQDIRQAVEEWSQSRNQ